MEQASHASNHTSAGTVKIADLSNTNLFHHIPRPLPIASLYVSDYKISKPLLTVSSTITHEETEVEVLKLSFNNLKVLSHVEHLITLRELIAGYEQLKFILTLFRSQQDSQHVSETFDAEFEEVSSGLQRPQKNHRWSAILGQLGRDSLGQQLVNSRSRLSDSFLNRCLSLSKQQSITDNVPPLILCTLNLARTSTLLHLPYLTELHLSGLLSAESTIEFPAGNKIDSVAAFRNCISLRILSLSSNQLASIETLSSLTNLTSVNLSNNSIADVTSVGFLTKLKDLFLANNSISSLP